MKLAWFFFIFSLNIAFCKITNYSDEQIVIMLNQYFEDSSGDQLLGNHIFTDDSENIIQVEIETNISNFNTSLTKAFAVVSTLTNVAKTNFTQAIVIFHFGTNKLPIIVKSDLNCSRKFFIEQTQNEVQWRKKCLSIQNF
tara:strand:- start:218 stop:637 length:420 start_codon:yes stop_codon:yes gene_type:complete